LRHRLKRASPGLCQLRLSLRAAARSSECGDVFPVAGMQGYVNLKGYGEFDAHDRASGWNAWVTFSTSPIAPHVAKNEASLMGR
jgi:hypothetical protein